MGANRKKEIKRKTCCHSGQPWESWISNFAFAGWEIENENIIKKSMLLPWIHVIWNRNLSGKQCWRMRDRRMSDWQKRKNIWLCIQSLLQSHWKYDAWFSETSSLSKRLYLLLYQFVFFTSLLTSGCHRPPINLLSPYLKQLVYWEKKPNLQYNLKKKR